MDRPVSSGGTAGPHPTDAGGGPRSLPRGAGPRPGSSSRRIAARTPADALGLRGGGALPDPGRFLLHGTAARLVGGKGAAAGRAAQPGYRGGAPASVGRTGRGGLEVDRRG